MNKLLKIIIALLGGIDSVVYISTPILLVVLLDSVRVLSDFNSIIFYTIGFAASFFRGIKVGWMKWNQKEDVHRMKISWSIFILNILVALAIYFNFGILPLIIYFTGTFIGYLTSEMNSEDKNKKVTKWSSLAFSTMQLT